MAIYIGLVHVDPGVVAALNTKHQVTEGELREAIQWPAPVLAAPEEHPEHGPRWVVIGTTAGGREVIAALLPMPSGPVRPRTPGW